MKNVLKTIILLLVLIVIATVIVKFKPNNNKTGETPIATVNYSCNLGKTITAAYYDTPKVSPAEGLPALDGSVKVDLSDGRSFTLPRALSADGARYANADESFVFWSKGNGALVLENNEQKSYIGCIMVKPEPEGMSMPAVYSNSAEGFSLRLPSLGSTTPLGQNKDFYALDESYNYTLDPNKTIKGIRFTIPTNNATGTNLSADTYISVEEIPNTQECSARLFVDRNSGVTTVTEQGTTYSLASSTDAAAGNRYEQIVYAIPGTNPCVAVRYFIHYGVFENYPEGSIKQFDKNALLKEFDAIRNTLVVNQ